MRLLIAMDDPGGAIRTALLQDGHQVRRHVPASRLMPWRATAMGDFAPEAVLADGEAGTALARRLGVPALRPELEAAFLPDPFPPAPFGPTRRSPPELALIVPDPPPPALLPDILLLGRANLHQAPHWMAAGRAIVAPQHGPAWLVHEETALLHEAGNPAPELARLVADAELAIRLGTAARQAFEERHAAARAALRRLVGT